MNEILWEIFELLVTLFEGTVSMHFVCIFLGINFFDPNERKHWFGLIICYSTTVTIMNLLTPYEGPLVLLYSIVVFLYSFFFLDSAILKKAAVSVLFICIIIMDSSLGVNLIASLLQATIAEIYAESDFARLITLLFVQSLNLLVFQILEKTICSNALKLNKREWLLLGIVFMLSVICFSLIQIAAVHIKMEFMIKLCFLGADLALVLIDYITIRLISALHKKAQTELENSQIKLQLQYQTKYADTVQQQEESVHRLRHDLKTTISALYDFLHNHRYSEMKQYLSTYAKSLSETASIVYTDQPFVNAILNTKLTFAKEHGVVCSCHSPKQLPKIAGTVYCSLLGNLLDNAIEATLTSETPEIVVTLDYIESKLTITVKNRIAASVLATNPQLHTSKNQKNEHGYGIHTINEIATSFNGTTDYYESDGWFIAMIVLYINQEKA